MTIDKDRISKMAAEAHMKMLLVDSLNKQLQKDKLPDTAAELAVAQVEYKRAKKALDNFMAEQSMIIVNPTDPKDGEIYDAK